ncbi:enhanced serine sensitivity protein SseB C-terminal domain-containing protein [Williamsia sp. M5A3_1d]
MIDLLHRQSRSVENEIDWIAKALAEAQVTENVAFESSLRARANPRHTGSRGRSATSFSSIAVLVSTAPQQPDERRDMHLDDAVSMLDTGALSQDDFLRELQTAEVAVPVKQTHQSGSALSVFAYGSHSCAAVFTTPERILTHLRDRPAAMLTGRQLAEQWPSDLVLSLNPTDDAPGLMIPPAEVQRMASDGLQRVVPAGSQTFIGAPAEEPPIELRRVVRDLVAATAEIDRAYLFQMGLGTQEASELVLGIVLRESVDIDIDTAMSHAAQWVADHRPGHPPIALLPLSDSLLDTVASIVPAVTGETR